MDFGGIIAGAMAGGGQAIQQNAQEQLEQQRQEALQRLENEFNMGVVEYEQNRADQRSTAEAISEARQAEAERRARMERLRAEQEGEQELARLEANLDPSGQGRTREDVLEARDREIREAIQNERDSRRAYGGIQRDEPIDTQAIAREISFRYSGMYPEYESDLMRGFPSNPSPDGDNGGNGGNGRNGLVDPSSLTID